MRNNLRLLYCLLLLAFLACKKEDTIGLGPDSDSGASGTQSCITFHKALITKNHVELRFQIDGLALDLLSKPTEEDPVGHARNVEILIDRLQNKCDDYQVALQCYACIYTLPAKSEIRFNLDSSGVAIQRIVDIISPKGEILQFINVH